MSSDSDCEYIDSFFSDFEKSISAVDRSRIEAVIQLLFEAWQNGKQIFLIGNGGSAGTASHFSADLNKCTACNGKRRMKAISLVDNVPLVSAITNDDGWENVYTEQLQNFFTPGDVLIAFSVHGGSGSDKSGPWSQNLLKAMRYVSEHGGKTIGIAGFDGGYMKELADECLIVPAHSTPQVEAFHVLLHHLIAFRLAEKIAAT
jgi:D-sedoheptulose 7-phosphate isomerase